MRKAILRASTLGCKLVEQYDSKHKAHNLPQRQTIQFRASLSGVVATSHNASNY